ncbi:hypothetical protein HZB93_00245 [Candidatus Falkowbacteria bacterium]|nr:hypothetical protein [Candidatus Falkowbacteria bacterium]
MGKPQYDDREPMSPEATAEVEIMATLDRLLGELEKGNLPEEQQGEIASEAREALKRYHKLFGKEAQETIDTYYKRLESAIKKAA